MHYLGKKTVVHVQGVPLRYFGAKVALSKK
jgi:hypothetical protein